MADVLDEIEEDVIDKVTNLVASNDTSTFDSDSTDDTFKAFDDSFISPGSEHHISSSHFCKKVLYVPICDGSNVRAWDVLLILPNLAFLIFLALRLGATNRKLRATNSPIFRAFHGLVTFNAVLAVVRAIVSMAVAGSADHGDRSAIVADKVLWIMMRFCLLATEMSVLVFGVAGGQMDTRRSIRRVVGVSIVVALVFSVSQWALEFDAPDPAFFVHNKAGQAFELFGHGGSAFWMTSSICLTLVYLTVLLLPVIPWARRSLALPNKASFYNYCGLMLALNAVQAFGSGLIQFASDAAGLCFVNMTSYFYLALYVPVVYATFLGPFFKTAQPTLLFSYKAQVDGDADDEEAVMDNNGSMSLSHGTLINDGEDQPIVRNGDAVSAALNSLTDGTPHALASPESVVNGQFDEMKY